MDQIPVKFPIEAADVLAISLSRFISLLVKLSAFPEECKIAEELQKYRPTLLPLFPEIIEKSIYHQSQNCREENGQRC